MENRDGCRMAFNKRKLNKSNVCHSTSRRVFLFLLVCLLVVSGFPFASIFQHWSIQEGLERIGSSHQDIFFIRHEQEQEEEEIGSAAIEEGTPEQKVGSPAWFLIEETRAAIKAAGGVPRTSLSLDERKAWNAAHPCKAREKLLRLWLREKKSPQGTNNSTTIPPANSKPSVLLPVLFQEYANLHRTCTHGGDMDYVTELYKSGNENSSPCKFLVVEFGKYGIGNRLLWLVSAYQYALLTKRVLLIDTRSTVNKLFCNPFPGSSWILPVNFPYSLDRRWAMPSRLNAAWDEWENRGLIVRDKTVIGENNSEQNDGLRRLDMNDIQKEKRETLASIRAKIQARGYPKTVIADINSEQNDRLRRLDMNDIQKEKRETLASILAKIQARGYPDRLRSSNKETTQNGVGGVQRSLTEEEPRSFAAPHFYNAQANGGWAPNPRFFCDNEQERLHRVKWISFSDGCLYFLPDLFAVPSFQPALEDLFPNRDPLTHLLRQLTLPVDSIWKNVQELYTKDFTSASRVVGMQVRYRDGEAMYRNLNSLVNKRISQCGEANGIIPDSADAKSAAIARSSWNSSSRGDHDGPVLIFIASLYHGLNQHLRSIYDEAMRKGGKNPPVKLLQLSELGFQSFDLDADHQAILEIISLSLADELLTSPLSTYGQIAQGFGGLTPWLIDFSNEDNGSTCVRGQSTDACFQLAVDKFTCPFNKELDGKRLAKVAPYLKTCQDSTDGLQLVPPWSPSLLLP